MGDFMDSEATDEEWRQWWLEYEAKQEKASNRALLIMHDKSASLDGCKTCAQNEAIIRRLMTAEGEPQVLHKEDHHTLREVYRNCEREQRARATQMLLQHEADFALQAHVECCAFEPEHVVRSVLLRWQSSGNEVRRGLAVGL